MLFILKADALVQKESAIPFKNLRIGATGEKSADRGEGNEPNSSTSLPSEDSLGYLDAITLLTISISPAESPRSAPAAPGQPSDRPESERMPS